MPEDMRILLVEDDREIAHIIREHLLREGYTVTWASTGKEGWEDFKAGLYDLVIVDLMLPEMDGFQLCRNIRWKSEVPLLMISAKHQDEDKVRGLQLGADDYLTKPFSLAEFTARIESHLRRFRRYRNKPTQDKKWEYKGRLAIYPEKRIVRHHDAEVHLTAKEYELLLLLATNPGRTFSKRELYEHVWGETDIPGNNTITVHMKSLRSKLKENIRQPLYIETVWGSGYRFSGERLS